MKGSSRIVISLALLATSMAALAQAPLKPVSTAIQKDPIAMAAAKIIRGADGKLHPVRVGNWIPYVRNVHIAASTGVAYDAYESDFSGTNGEAVPAEVYTPYCNSAGSSNRWWTYGGGYYPGWRYNDLPVTAGAVGALSDRVAFAFSVGPLAPVTNFEVFIYTTENYVKTAGTSTTGANDSVARGDYTGVVFNYGLIPISSGGYYYTDADLSTGGLSLQMPMDGNGGILAIMGDVDANNNITLCGDFVYWGIKGNNPTPQQDGTQWDDDAPADLVFTDGTGGTNNELYDYTNWVTCPQISGIMMAFYYPGSGTTTETLAPTSNTVNLGKLSSGNLASLAADDNNAMTVCKFIVPSQTSPIIRMTQGYTTTKANPTNIELDVKAKLVNAGAFKIRGFVHNYSILSDVQVIADTTLTLSYATYTGTATGTLTDYIGASNAMQTKVEIQQTGPSTVTAPCVNFEFINLKVTG